jgi:hypothetical protein
MEGEGCDLEGCWSAGMTRRNNVMIIICIIILFGSVHYMDSSCKQDGRPEAKYAKSSGPMLLTQQRTRMIMKEDSQKRTSSDGLMTNIDLYVNCPVMHFCVLYFL